MAARQLLAKPMKNSRSCARSACGSSPAPERLAIGVERSRQPRQVREVLDQGLAAIDSGIGKRPIGGELGHERLAEGVVTRLVLRGPPVARGALHVVARAQRIDKVGQLVREDGPDGAVVGGVGRGGVELRRLQERGGEVVRVELEVQHGDGPVGRDRPLAAIHVASELRQRLLVSPALDAAHVAERVLGIDDEPRRVRPLVRIADAEVERVQLRQGHAAGLRRHPCGGGDASPGCGHDLVEDRPDTRLSLRREVARHIEPPHFVGQHAARRLDGTLAARRGRGMERPGVGGEALRQDVGLAVEQLEAQVVLPNLKPAEKATRAAGALDRLGLPDHEVLLPREARRRRRRHASRARALPA
jgi:hypothetical protein